MAIRAPNRMLQKLEVGSIGLYAGTMDAMAWPRQVASDAWTFENGCDVRPVCREFRDPSGAWIREVRG